MKKFKEFLIMNLGCILLSIGVYFFKIPNGFVTGGVTGLGTIFAQITPISAGAWIWILNIALLFIGFIFLGRGTGIKTVYCSMFYSALTYVFEFFIPLTSPLSDQPLLELVYAMLLTSIGSAMIFNTGASSGGTDIVALVMKKYTSLNIGRSLLFSDFVVAASSFFVFDIKAGLFSILGLFSKAFIVDTVISDYIIKIIHHGATVNEVVGEYTKEKKYMIHTVCRRAEAIKLRAKIKEIDEKAFIIITTSSEIIGRGFRTV